MKKKSLKTKYNIIIIIILILLTINLLINLLSINFNDLYFESNTKLLEDVRILNKEIICFLNNSPSTAKFKDVTDRLSKFFKNKSELKYIVIYNKQGKFYKYFKFNNPGQSLIYKILPGSGKGKKYSAHFIKKQNKFKVYFRNSILETFTPLSDNGRTLGYLNIGFLKYKTIFPIIENITTNIITIILVIIIILFFIYLNKDIFKPIANLTKITTKVSKGEVIKKLKIKSDNEIGALAKAVNLTFGTVKERLEDLQTIQIMSMDISSALELNEVLSVIIKLYTNRSKASKCAVLLADKKNVFLNLASGMNLVRKNFKIKFGEGVSGKVALSCNYLVVENLQEYPDYLMFINPEDTLENSLLLCVPMVVKDKLNGVICLTGLEADKTIKKSEIMLYQTLATSAAAAIENSRLYELAITDGLTKAYIHRFFQLKLEEEIEFAEKNKTELSLIMLDIDHFKTFNDTYGHQQGDVVLIDLVKILKNNVRIIDVKSADRRGDIVARYGGEEFTVILPETDKKTAVKVAERIRASIEKYEFPGQEKPLKVTASLGVANLKKEYKNKDIIRDADIALYKAKESGRNKVCIAE